MGRLLKGIIVLLVLGFAALTAFAYLGDLTPDQTEVRQPVTLNLEQPVAPQPVVPDAN